MGEFHQIKLDNSGLLYSAWKNLLNNLCLALNDSPLLMQCVYDEIYSLLVKEYFSLQSNSQSSASSAISFTDDELNAMRYACGYIPHVLLKKYEVRDAGVFSQYVECLGNMAVEGSEGDDLLAYTRKWFTLVNRGGLFPLNNNSFSMFIEIEKCVHHLLPQCMIRNDNDKASFKKSVLERITREESTILLDIIVTRY